MLVPVGVPATDVAPITNEESWSNLPSSRV
jgi:hypothetical protein